MSAGARLHGVLDRSSLSSSRQGDCCLEVHREEQEGIDRGFRLCFGVWLLRVHPIGGVGVLGDGLILDGSAGTITAGFCWMDDIWGYFPCVQIDENVHMEII